MSARARFVSSWLFAFALIGCASTKTVPVTEVLVEIDADPQVRALADTLRVEIASGPPSEKQLAHSGTQSFALGDAKFRWPASIALVAQSGHVDHAFELTISAEQAGSPVAMARVRSGFVRNKTVLLSEALLDACIGHFDCKSDETCKGDANGAAQCVSWLVDASTLPIFDMSEVRDGGSSAPFRDAGTRDAGNHDAGAHDAGAIDAGSHDAGMDASHPNDAGVDAASSRDAASDAGAPRDSGSDAANCVPAGPENCWNGVDDDCNGDVDCADSACAPVATCVPDGPVIGVLVPDSAACPTNFTHSQMLIHQGLVDGGCVGCSCMSSATTCLPYVYYYDTATACTADTVHSAGTLVATPTTTCSSQPLGEAQSKETPPAWRVQITTLPGSCSANGTPNPVPPSWSTDMKLCTTTEIGGGCGAGSVCMRKPSSASTTCSQKSAAACPASAPSQRWYLSYSDSRSCASCTCTASGSSCANVAVQLGHDWSCGAVDDMLYDGQQNCNLSTYAPPGILVGSPQNPTCSATSATNGTLSGTEPLDLCCSP